MPGQLSGRPTHLLMTVDAVGGVWRYAMDAATALRRHGVETLFVGLGPQPSARQRAEAEAIGRLIWLDLPLDWLVETPEALDSLPAELARLVEAEAIDLVHLNGPTQAHGLELDRPVVVASHSCVVTWFRAVRDSDVDPAWSWQRLRNRAGLMTADCVLAPSRSHAAMLEACYGAIPALQVIPNATSGAVGNWSKEAFVLAAGRWWDEGKNGTVLDEAAGWADWPVLMAGATQGPNGQRFAIAHAHALGELPASRLRALLATAAIVASPSIYEPFGLVALEAANAGAALVLADIPTYRELWAEAALFVPPRAAKGWTEALNGLARDPGRRAELGERARQRAERFTLEAQSAALLAAYAAATARAGASRMVA